MAYEPVARRRNFPIPKLRKPKDDGNLFDRLVPNFIPWHGQIEKAIQFGPLLVPTVGVRVIKGLGQAVLGIPVAVQAIFRGEFRELGNAIVQGYKEDYGMLADGDIIGFLDHLYNHPTGPLLDAAAVVTLGAGAAVRGAGLAGRAGAGLGRAGGISSKLSAFHEGQFTVRTASVRTRPFWRSDIPGAAKTTDLFPIVDPNPVCRFTRLKTHQLVSQIVPEGTPIIGHSSRLSKATLKAANRVQSRAAAQGLRWHEKWRKVGGIVPPISRSKRQARALDRQAMHLAAKGFDPEEWRLRLELNQKAGGLVEPEMIALMSNKALIKRVDEINTARLSGKAFDEFDPRMQRILEALDEGDKLASIMANLLVDYMGYAPEAVLAKPFESMHRLTGAKFGAADEMLKRLDELDGLQDATRRDLKAARAGVPELGRKIRDIGASGAARRAVKQTDEYLQGYRKDMARLAELTDDVMRATTKGDDMVPQYVLPEQLLDDILPDHLRRVGARPGVTPGDTITRDQFLAVVANNLYAREMALNNHMATNLGKLRSAQAAARRAAAKRTGGKRAEALTRLDELLSRERSFLHEIQRERSNLFDERLRIAEEIGIEVDGVRLANYRRAIHDGTLEKPFYMPEITSSDMALVLVDNMKPNKGLNIMAGKVALGDDVLSPAYLQVIRRVHGHELRNFMEEHAIEVTTEFLEQNGYKAPKGHVFLKAGDKRVAARMAQDAVGRTKRADDMRQLETLINDDVAKFGKDPAASLSAGEVFTGVDVSGIAKRGDKFLIVPKKVMDNSVRDLKRLDTLVDNIFHKPVAVWRTIVLGTRPAFFVNNMVGNTLLYAMAFGGNHSIKGLLNGFAHFSDDPKVAFKLLTDKKFRRQYRAFADQFYLDHFGDQILGTRGMQLAAHTVEDITLEAIRPFAHAEKHMKRVIGDAMSVPGRYIAFTGRVVEGRMRQAAIEAYIRGTPAIRKMQRGMKDDPLRWYKAARREFERNPKLLQVISDDINNALGDYLNMSAFERQYLRNFAPFYSWLRAITNVTLRMPARHPGRTLALTRLGEAGLEMQLEKYGLLPDFLLGAIELPAWLINMIGGDSQVGRRANLMTTQAMNPYASFEQVQSAAMGIFFGDDQGIKELGGLAGPHIQVMVEQLSGKDLLTNAPVEQGAFPAAREFTVNLPPGKLVQRALGHDFPGSAETLYERSLRESAASSMGIPFKAVNISRAIRLRRQQEEGRR